MVGRNVAKWLDELRSDESKIRLKAADHLLKTSEYYFDDKKVSPSEREAILGKIASSIHGDEYQIRLSVIHITTCLNIWNQTTRNLITVGLGDDNPSVLAHSVYAAGEYKNKASPLLGHLLKLTDHTDREVRWRIPWAICEIKQCPEGGLRKLLKLAQDDDYLVRMYALDAISSCFNSADSQIYKAVVKALKDEDASVRGAACRAIKRMEGNWRWVKWKLKSMIKHEAHGLQAEAILALCAHWPESTSDRRVNNWLKENSGLWWAQDLLDGKKVEP